MPYIVLKLPPAYRQLTFEEILAGTVKDIGVVRYNSTSTKTYYTEHIDPKLFEKFNIQHMIDVLARFVEENQELINAEKQSLYYTFHIPKRSGGLRRIDAPNPELMKVLRDLKAILENHPFYTYHTSAFGYVKGRCTKDSLVRHQKNDSHWFLKVDFSNFFGNSTPDFVMKMMSVIFPYSEIIKTPQGSKVLSEAMSLCFLNGGLPQGTPISPWLTNLIMIPIDFHIANTLRNYNYQTYIYTRYADDILISSRKDFDPNVIKRFIKNTLEYFEAPFTFKEEKTRYASRAGSNWNLGLMLNKDNEITVGHKNKQRFRAMLTNYIRDKQNGIIWDLHDVQILMGILNYYHQIEEKYIDELVASYNAKYNIDLMDIVVKDLKR